LWGKPILGLFLRQQFSYCLPLHLVGSFGQQLSIVLKILAMDELFHGDFQRIDTNQPLTLKITPNLLTNLDHPWGPGSATEGCY
jgi:hypothetical protein